MKKKIYRSVTLIVCLVILVGLMLHSPSWLLPTLGDELNAKTNNRNDVLTVQDNNFLSRTKTSYANINGKTVDVYTFFREVDESQNNPNFSQILLVKQCIDYKIAHPEEEVSMAISSFHLSTTLAACLDPTSEEYGHLKCLYDEEYTSDGYYRLSYLLVEAARMGIEVFVLGHLDANPVLVSAGTSRPDGNFEAFFPPYLDDPSYIDGKTIGDFMTFRKFYWTSYGDQAASDMMHVKACVVSNYIDSNGVEHGGTTWMGSINLDGVDYLGRNGHNSIQSGIILSDHEEVYRITTNYLRIMSQYYYQEGSTVFRDLVSTMATEQIALLSEGRGEEIPDDEQIVYIGTENDSVFELYFTPFGGSAGVWDPIHNPYCKYLQKLLPATSGEEYIEVIWNNLKFDSSFDLYATFSEVIGEAFRKNGNPANNLHLQLGGLNTSYFWGLEEGKNIGVYSVNEYNYNYHIKDLQLTYSENGERHFVTLYNTMNMHEGTISYQANSLLVINETAETGNNVYIDYAIMTTPGINFEERRIQPAE